jgi:hypothetical protein
VVGAVVGAAVGAVVGATVEAAVGAVDGVVAGPAGDGDAAPVVHAVATNSEMTAIARRRRCLASVAEDHAAENGAVMLVPPPNGPKQWLAMKISSDLPGVKA